MSEEPEMCYGLAWLQNWAKESEFKELMPDYYLFETLIHWDFFRKNTMLKGLKPVSRILYELDTKGESSPGKLSIPGFVLRNYFWLRLQLRHEFATKRRSLTGDVVLLCSDQFAKENDEDDLFWGDIIKELKAQGISYKTVFYDRLWTANSIKKLRLISKGKNFIGNYYDRQTMKKIRQKDRSIRNRWKMIRDSEQFRGSLIYKGKDIADLLIPHFDFVFNVMSLYIAEVYVTAEILATVQKPKVLLMDSEENYYGKAYNIIKNDNRDDTLKTVAMQYEQVYKYCGHRHIQGKFPSRPMPDIKCVSGPEAKKILVEECNYPEKIITIIGSPRHDGLKKEYNQEEIRKELGLPRDDKIILYPASDVDYEEITRLLCGINFDMVSIFEHNRAQTTLLVKPHPNVDLKEFKKYVKTSDRVRLIDGDVFQLLRACDVVITRGSSVAAEAILLGKPVIIASPGGEVSVAYVKIGAALGTNYEPGNILTAYSVALKYPKKLVEGRKLFIKKYYNNFGSSAKKVVEVIKKWVS